MAMIKTNLEKTKEDDEKDNYSGIKPSGFIQATYDTSIISTGYLYHRCHLIACELGGIDVRVTPYFEGDNELANGVNIEAYSIEDNGKLEFNVYVYNVQNGIEIDYTTGESRLAEEE